MKSYSWKQSSAVDGNKNDDDNKKIRSNQEDGTNTNSIGKKHRSSAAISAPNNTWKRETSQAETKKNAPLAISEPHPYTLQRRGRHSLRLQVPPPATKAAAAAGAVSTKTNTWVRPKDAKNVPTTSTQQSTTIETRALRTENGQSTVSDTIHNNTATHKQQQQQSLTRVAPYKLVHGVQPSVHNKRGPLHAAKGRSTVKRIKLNKKQPPTPNNNDMMATNPDEKASDQQQGELISGCQETAVNGDNHPQQQLLTDCAYRVVSKKPLSRAGRRRPNNNNNNNNTHNALIRMNPSQTPICPTFLRGQVCINEQCRKRHDVPLQYCQPVCSFFQNQGMCLRQECPFRHVKLERNAMLCPSFELLGYCEDEECKMMHSYSSKRKKKK